MESKANRFSRRTLFAGLVTATAGLSLLGRFAGTPEVIKGGFGDHWEWDGVPREEATEWTWWVETPKEERTILQSGSIEGSNPVRLMLEYPYPGETVYGTYRYGLSASGVVGEQVAATSFEVTFRPYRFGS